MVTSAGARGAGDDAATRHRLPLVVHVLLLAVVLLLVLPLTKPGVSYTSDEGAAILQARRLEDSGSWVLHDPMASVDPEGHARPVPRADSGTKGRAPYAKHPLYALVLAGADGAAGTAGLVGAGIVGTVLAAWGAGLLARRLRPDLGAVAVWTVGLATPLFFDTYVVLAHTLAAAAAAFAVLCALHALSSHRFRVVLFAASAALLVALTAALRTEGAFIGVGLALAAAIEWRRGRAPIGAAVMVAGGGLAAVAAVHFGERVFVHHVLGTAVANIEGSQAGPWLSGRYHGLLATWFTPSYRHEGAGDFALILGVIVLALAALLVRLRRGSSEMVVVALGVVAAAYVIRLLAPPGAIPGLVAAFPIGWAAAWLVERRGLTGPGAPLVAVGAFLAVAVLVTQVSIGGGVEWGGRYFAVALPVVAPFFVWVLAERAPNVAPVVARASVVVAAVTTLALCATAVKTLSHTHAQTRRLVDAISAAGRDARGAGSDTRPVVVSTERLLPQLAWSRFDRFRWLSPHEADLATYGHRLASAGVDRLVLVSPDPDTQVGQLGDYREVARPTVGGRPPPVPVIVLARR